MEKKQKKKKKYAFIYSLNSCYLHAII